MKIYSICATEKNVQLAWTFLSVAGDWWRQVNKIHGIPAKIAGFSPLDWNSPCRVEGLPTKKFLPSASTRRAQLSVAAEVVRPTDLLNNVKYLVNTD